MSWTPERIEELKKLWDAGHSASEIGKKLGVSKNAVVGKAHRLKLSSRPSPIKRGGPTTRRRPAASQRQAAARAATASPLLNTGATTVAEPTGKPVSQSPFAPPVRSSRPAPTRSSRRATGTQACAWPIGDPGDPDFHFCGEQSVPGKPYCEAHCSQAYITKKKDEAA
jgi:GcrA cell cycle regulator